MKKIIILNWRWGNVELNKFNTEIIGIDEIIFLSKYSKSDQFNAYIKNKLESINENKECIVLSHYSEEGYSTINIAPNEINKPENFNGVFIVNKFSDAIGMVYYSDLNKDGLLNIELDKNNTSPSETIVSANFQKVWDYYRNENTLENLKKKIINLFLPLDIDYKVLNDISDHTKRLNYVQEVSAQYTSSYIEGLQEGWKEIKEILTPEHDYSVLDGRFEFTSQENYLLTTCPLEDFFKQFPKNQSYPALSDWFTKVVDMLNDKIAGHQ